MLGTLPRTHASHRDFRDNEIRQPGATSVTSSGAQWPPEGIWRTPQPGQSWFSQQTLNRTVDRSQPSRSTLFWKRKGLRCSVETLEILILGMILWGSEATTKALQDLGTPGSLESPEPIIRCEVREWRTMRIADHRGGKTCKHAC